MWAGWLSHWFHIQKNDIVDQNISLSEYVGMWDSTKES